VVALGPGEIGGALQDLVGSQAGVDVVELALPGHLIHLRNLLVRSVGRG
jgi:hypothetical protein